MCRRHARGKRSFWNRCKLEGEVVTIGCLRHATVVEVTARHCLRIAEGYQDRSHAHRSRRSYTLWGLGPLRRW